MVMRAGWSSVRIWLGVLLPFAGIACSAGERLNRVEGKVLYKKEPVKGAMVTFHPKDGDPMKTRRPTALTKDDGTFVLSTGDKEGALAGHYVVTFIWYRETAQKKFNQPFDPRDSFGGAYENPATSAFKVEIKNGVNKLEPFELK